MTVVYLVPVLLHLTNALKECCFYPLLFSLQPRLIMSEVDTTTNGKKRVCADETDDEVEVIRVVQATTKPNAKPSKRLNVVYLALSCGVPLKNYKWGEHAGYET
jgi:hypothetical protein